MTGRTIITAVSAAFLAAFALQSRAGGRTAVRRDGNSVFCVWARLLFSRPTRPASVREIP